jgi:hypothetical protein
VFLNGGQQVISLFINPPPDNSTAVVLVSNGIQSVFNVDVWPMGTAFSSDADV